METNRSLNSESPNIDPEQIKPGEIWEISRCVQAPIRIELQEEQRSWAITEDIHFEFEDLQIDRESSRDYNDIIVNPIIDFESEWVLPPECIQFSEKKVENTPHGTPVAGVACGASSNTGSLELNAIAPLKLYPTSAQSFFNGNSPPRYVMIVTEPEPPEDLAEEWRVISVMMLSVKSDRLSDVDILIPSEISEVGQDLLAETWNVVPMLACNLLRPVGRRLSREIYDVLLDVGDSYNELTETPVSPQKIESFGLRFGSASAKEAPEIQAFHQQEEDWAAVLELPVAAYRTYLNTIQETENLLEIAIEVEREFGELQDNLNSGKNQSLIHLSQWFKKTVEEGWHPIMIGTSAVTSEFRFRGIEDGRYSLQKYVFETGNDGVIVEADQLTSDKSNKKDNSPLFVAYSAACNLTEDEFQVDNTLESILCFNNSVEYQHPDLAQNSPDNSTSNFDPSTDTVESEAAIAPIETLIERLQSESDERNRQQVAKQLGQIGRGNPDAIDALTELISTTEDEETLWTAVESLWQIAPDCPAAGVRRAKLFQLGQQPTSETVALTVALVEKPADNIGILLRVYPTGDKLCLPTDLQLVLCDESGADLFPPVIARPGDAYIQLKLSGLSGEQFSVTLALAESSITEHFLI